MRVKNAKLQKGIECKFIGYLVFRREVGLFK
jgi:hypothetical protein